MVRELVIDTCTQGKRLSQDALEVFFPAVEYFKGVLDSILELLVAASHKHFASHIQTHPVKRVLALRVVDKLRPHLLHTLQVSLAREAYVELISNLNVDFGLYSDGRLFINLNGSLYSFK